MDPETGDSGVRRRGGPGGDPGVAGPVEAVAGQAVRFDELLRERIGAGPARGGGVEGGVGAQIGASWNDINDDEKFRLPELISRVEQGLFCIFDLEGAMTAFLRAYGGVGINIFGKKIVIFEAEVDLLDITIFEFSVGCPPLPPPVLAQRHPP